MKQSLAFLFFALFATACTQNNAQVTTSAPAGDLHRQAHIQAVDHDSSQFQKAVDIAVGPGMSCAILENGDGKCWGASFSGRMGWNGSHWRDFENVSVIGAGVDAACAAVGPARELQCTGYSVQFDLHKGPKNKLTGITEIAMDEVTGCAVSKNLVSCWGHDLYGQTGASGISLKNPRLLRVFDSMSCVASDDGVVCWNYLGWGLDAPKDLKQVTDMVVSGYNVCAMDNVRGLICWRANDDRFHGGYSEYTAVKSSLKMSNLHFESFREICGIQGEQIQCFDLETFANRTLELPIKNSSKLVFGSDHVCALTDRGVECSGSNKNGETIVPQGFKKPFQVAAAWNFTCALAENGMSCWGDNTNGQITPPFEVKKPVQIATNGYSTCVDDEDTFRCWTKKQSNLLASAEFYSVSGLHGAKSLVMARDFSSDRACGIKDAKVICGYYAPGKEVVQGLQNPRELSVSANGGCAISDSGAQCWQWGYTTMVAKPLSVPLVNPRLLSVGDKMGCAVADDGLKCWDKDNKLRPVPTLTDIGELRTSNGGVCALSLEGASCWNYYSYGGMTVKMNPVPENLEAPRGLSMSTTNACVITNTGIRCWDIGSGKDQLVPSYSLVK